MEEIKLDINKLKQISPEIRFNEWKINKWEIVTFYNLLAPEIKHYEKTVYYLFSGCFETENKIGVVPKIECKFWITQQCFETEIIRHIDFTKINTNCIVATFTMARINNKKIKIKNMIQKI
jgi:hypothetical protein